MPHNPLSRQVPYRINSRLKRKDVPAAKRAVIRALVHCGTVTEACRAALIGRSTFYQWRKRDQAFAARVEEIRAAIRWQSRPQPPGPFAEMSSAALMAMLRAGRPHKYGDRWRARTARPL
jgi:hypothetical protein